MHNPDWLAIVIAKWNVDMHGIVLWIFHSWFSASICASVHATESSIFCILKLECCPTNSTCIQALKRYEKYSFSRSQIQHHNIKLLSVNFNIVYSMFLDWYIYSTGDLWEGGNLCQLVGMWPWWIDMSLMNSWAIIRWQLGTDISAFFLSAVLNVRQFLPACVLFCMGAYIHK